MVKPAKGGARGVVTTGLGPEIRVRAPCGVVQQAGGLDQPQLVLRRLGKKGPQELEELLAKTRNAGLNHLGHPCGLDQGVARTQHFGHLFV